MMRLTSRRDIGYIQNHTDDHAQELQPRDRLRIQQA